MTRWSREQVEKLAPDKKSVTAAQKLAKPGPWSETGSTDVLVWGKCQGSGTKAYQVTIDLTGPAFKCTCPSRKFPCKHGLALLFLWVDNDGAIGDMPEAADFAQSWADGRAERKEKRAAKVDKPVDPVAKAKRQKQRIDLMTEGMKDFELWLFDLYRQGFALAKQKPYGYWDEAAARLLDCQLPGLAAHVRSTGGEIHAATDWASYLLTQTGLWYLAIQTWLRHDSLTSEDMGNLRAYLGWSYSKDEIAATPPQEDAWHIEGAIRSEDGKLQTQRTWLRGETTGERVLLLDFSANGAGLTTLPIVGSIMKTSLATYPGAGVRRAMLLGEPSATQQQSTTLAADSTLEMALKTVSKQFARNPFLRRVPLCINAAIRSKDGALSIVDSQGSTLPLASDIDPWPLLAAVGPSTNNFFGELERGYFRPLSIVSNQKVVPV